MERRILDAARAVVADRGMCSASVTAIAERAGVGKPTLYLRWRGLNEVVTAAFEDLEWTEEIGARFRAAIAALDALAEMPDGRFLTEIIALSAQERLGWLTSGDGSRRLETAGPGDAIATLDGSG